MNYAIVTDGIVTNIIWMLQANEVEFPGAVLIDNRPVTIGDSYAGGVFLRDNEPVLTRAEELQAYYDAMQEVLDNA